MRWPNMTVKVYRQVAIRANQARQRRRPHPQLLLFAARDRFPCHGFPTHVSRYSGTSAGTPPNSAVAQHLPPPPRYTRRTAPVPLLARFPILPTGRPYARIGVALDSSDDVELSVTMASLNVLRWMNPPTDA